MSIEEQSLKKFGLCKQRLCAKIMILLKNSEPGWPSEYWKPELHLTVKRGGDHRQLLCSCRCVLVGYRPGSYAVSTEHDA